MVVSLGEGCWVQFFVESISLNSIMLKSEVDNFKVVFDFWFCIFDNEVWFKFLLVYVLVFSYVGKYLMKEKM